MVRWNLRNWIEASVRVNTEKTVEGLALRETLILKIYPKSPDEMFFLFFINHFKDILNPHFKYQLYTEPFLDTSSGRILKEGAQTCSGLKNAPFAQHSGMKANTTVVTTPTSCICMHPPRAHGLKSPIHAHYIHMYLREKYSVINNCGEAKLLQSELCPQHLTQNIHFLE